MDGAAVCGVVPEATVDVAEMDLPPTDDETGDEVVVSVLTALAPTGTPCL